MLLRIVANGVIVQHCVVIHWCGNVYTYSRCLGDGKLCCYVLLATGSLSSAALSFIGELVFTLIANVWVKFCLRATLCCQGVIVHSCSAPPLPFIKKLPWCEVVTVPFEYWRAWNTIAITGDRSNSCYSLMNCKVSCNTACFS